jgi:hypothetical protein
MLQDVAGLAIIVLFYVCLAIIVFAPTLYAVWFYIVSRKIKGKSNRLLKTAISVFLVNAVFAYLLLSLASQYFLPQQAAEKDAAATDTIRTAIASQKRFFDRHGRYYLVGPVRGPYNDEYGVVVEKDVILEVTPMRDKKTGAESFEAYAIHVWGRKVVSGRPSRAEDASLEPDEEHRIRAKLFNSLK